MHTQLPVVPVAVITGAGVLVGLAAQHGAITVISAAFFGALIIGTITHAFMQITFSIGGAE